MLVHDPNDIRRSNKIRGVINQKFMLAIDVSTAFDVGFKRFVVITCLNVENCVELVVLNGKLLHVACGKLMWTRHSNIQKEEED